MSMISLAYKENESLHTVILQLNGEVTQDLFSQGITALLNEFIPYIKKTQDTFYQLEIQLNNQTLSESDFWKQAIDDYKLKELSIQYLEELLQLVKSGKPIWADEENPAARFVALQLAKHAVKCVPYYTEHVKWHDMDHEVYEGEDIDELIQKYGWSNETLELAAVRAGIAMGQFGNEQFNELADNGGLKQYLEENDLLNHFIFDVYLDPYLKHYLDLTKSKPHFRWPMKYCIDFTSDLLEMLVDQDQYDELFSQCKARVNQLYSKHNLVM